MKANENLSYEEFLERIRIEIGDFLRSAELGKTNRHQGMKSRKISMYLRSSLKEFRKKSIKHEKKITEMYKKTKKEYPKQIDDSFSN